MRLRISILARHKQTTYHIIHNGAGPRLFHFLNGRRVAPVDLVWKKVAEDVNVVSVCKIGCSLERFRSKTKQVGRTPGFSRSQRVELPLSRSAR